MGLEIEVLEEGAEAGDVVSFCGWGEPDVGLVWGEIFAHFIGFFEVTLRGIVVSVFG